MSKRQSIDWQKVKARLQDNQAAIDRSLAVDSEHLQRVYRDRALQLAARRVAKAEESNVWPALIFKVAGERFCIPLAALVEMLPYVRCSPLPGARPELLGVINVRGEICSVLDLARILQLPAGDNTIRGYVVLVRHDGAAVGLRVDEIEKIELVSSETLTNLDGSDSAPGGRLALGRTPGRATLLNVEMVLSRPNH